MIDNRDDEYEIPENYRIMSRHAAVLAYRINKRLIETPDCPDYYEYYLVDAPAFINEKLVETGELIPELTEAINAFGSSESEYQIEEAVENLEEITDKFLTIIDEIRCVDFQDDQDARQLLLSAICKILQQTAFMYQGLQLAMEQPDYFLTEDDAPCIDLTIELECDHELAALEAWVEKKSKESHDTSSFGWGHLLAAFGLGWWVGKE